MNHPTETELLERYEAFEDLALAAQRHEEGVYTLDQVRQAAQHLIELGDIDGFASQLIDDIDHHLGHATQEAA
jgi:hypothetical protein